MYSNTKILYRIINPLNAELNPICHLLALLGVHHYLYISRIRVKHIPRILFYHHHISVMELGHLLTRSGLTYSEVSSKICHDSFCQLGNSVSLLWVIYYGTFYLHVVYSFPCIPVICLKFVLFLIPLQFVHLFCNQTKIILLFFSCISILLLLFF
jgi:hypothetical protein